MVSRGFAERTAVIDREVRSYDTGRQAINGPKVLFFDSAKAGRRLDSRNATTYAGV